MRFNRLVLRNFGLFRGEQSIDLRLREDGGSRPIILIGGHNGAGKTTLLEAVKICLHGRLALGSRVTDVAYQAYLRDRLHRGTGNQPTASYASVGLEFDYSHLGKRYRYFVQRGWEPRGASGVREGIRVLRDGEPLDEVDADLWSDFVRSLIPPGVAQLFFFDGEKIKRLADEETEALALGESIKALLGLDLVERLQADLDVFSAKQARRTARAETAKRLRELDKELKRLRGDLEGLDREIESHEDTREQLAGRVREVEERLAQSGEGLSSRREDLRQEEATLIAETAATEKSAREELDGVAPFLFCQRTAARLMHQLDAEAKRHKWEIGRKHAEEAIRTVCLRLTSAKNREGVLDDKASDWIENTIAEFREELADAPTDVRTVRIVHGLSDLDRQSCNQALRIATTPLTRKLSALFSKLVALEGELSECKRKINRVPDDAELAPIVAELTGFQEKLTRTEMELTLLVERRASLQKDLAVREREQERLERAEIDSERASARLALASRARDAASEYLERLTVAKTAELERQALDAFQGLSRKEGFVAGLRIDPKTFEVQLFDARGEVIPKASLSAGEKQIYAISLLWGMARVSGRPLPMIVDTPLGRLDSQHRSKLVSRYFPEASHQVVLLSTDTEVDLGHYGQLSSYTSHAYRLVDHSGWTEAKEGYFWEKERVESNG